MGSQDLLKDLIYICTQGGEDESVPSGPVVLTVKSQ